jgi:4-amino-4-deoxy-L-arabinose transferase-like glycosyltransferase
MLSGRGRPRRAGVLALGLVLLLGFALRLPTFGRLMLSSDEAAYAAVADAMQRGAVLYRDIVDHKPPAIFDVYLASARLLGPYNTQLAHLLVVLAVLLTACALARAARRLWPDDRAGWVAALLFVVFSTTLPDFDALAANCELFLLAAQAAAFAWLLSSWRSGRPGAFVLFGVGLLTGVAVVFKYQGAVFLAVPAAALALEAWSGRRSVPFALGGLALVLAGTLVVPGLYLARAWAEGGLSDWWFWFRFNFTYIDAGPGGLDAVGLGLFRTLLVATAAFLPYAFGLAGAWGTLRAWRGRWRPGAGRPGSGLWGRTLAVVWLAVSAVAVVPGYRFFGHYFHLVLPALSLLAAGPLVAFWDRFGRLRPALVALVVVPAAVALSIATVLQGAVMGRLDPKPPYAVVAARLRQLSGPDDGIFVWGHSVEVYVLSRRPAGTRFIFCDYLTGTSPGTASQKGLSDPTPNVVPLAWSQLFDDLERRRPRLFVDLSPAGWNSYDRFPVSRYPLLAAYLKARYRERSRVAGVVIYERDDR